MAKSFSATRVHGQMWTQHRSNRETTRSGVPVCSSPIRDLHYHCSLCGRTTTKQAAHNRRYHDGTNPRNHA